MKLGFRGLGAPESSPFPPDEPERRLPTDPIQPTRVQRKVPAWRVIRVRSEPVQQLVIMILRLIFPKLTLLSFKFRGLACLVGALLVDIGIKLVIQYPNIAFEITGPEITIALAVVIAYICAIFCDTIDSKRKYEFKEKMLATLSSPNVPDDVKKAIGTEIPNI